MKLLLGLLLLPCLLGFNGKNSVKNQVNPINMPSFSIVSRSTESDAFVTYWQTDFRVNNPEVCNIKYDAYKQMYDKYLLLSKEDREVVNSVQDTLEPEYTIGSIIRTLVNRFYPNNKKVTEQKQKLDQSTIIIIATVVAIAGATSISILYILKNQKVIK